LDDSRDALEIAKKVKNGFSTCGVHPTRCTVFEESGDPEGYFEKLQKFATKNETVKAIGECGLDYDRLHFCPAETQKVWFERQLKIAHDTQKPLFLHMRAAAKVRVNIIFYICYLYKKTFFCKSGRSRKFWTALIGRARQKTKKTKVDEPLRFLARPYKRRPLFLRPKNRNEKKNLRNFIYKSQFDSVAICKIVFSKNADLNILFGFQYRFSQTSSDFKIIFT